MDYPKTRKEAMAQGAAHYFTGKPCTRGHIAPRETKGNCTECRKEDHKRTYDARKEYFVEYNKSEAGQAAKKRYYAENKEVVVLKALSRSAEDKRRYKDKHKKANPDYYAADCKHRRRKHRDATPGWLTAEQKRQIRDIYMSARRISKETGEPYVVDHIIPLRHPDVCGLHVPWNLRVMTREANLLKSNKLEGSCP